MSDVFNSYARYYDLLYRDKDYGREAEYVASHIRRHAPGPGHILELGCGTGAHAEHLARLGFTVHGVERSAAMLERAQARRAALPEDLASRVSFSHGDIRSVRTTQTYDVVISLFHVMSYQITNADLDAAFETASAHLKPGGLFLFDFWYGPAVLTQKPEVRVKRMGDQEIHVTRIAEPKMLLEQNCVRVNYSVMINRTNHACELINEAHELRYLFLPEVSRMCARSFDVLETVAWMSDDRPSCADWSAFAILMRH